MIFYLLLFIFRSIFFVTNPTEYGCVNMLKVESENISSNIHNQWNNELDNVKEDESQQWLLLKNHNEKLNYRFDSVAEFFGREDSKHDGVGFSFDFHKPLQPGICLDVAIPMPKNMRPYQAEVVSCTEVLCCSNQNNRYEIGIWLRIDSELDLISIQKSCEYLNQM